MKIPSSYNKLIKNKYIKDDSGKKKVLDLDYKLIPTSLDLDSELEGEEIFDTENYDLNDIKKQIEKSVVRDIENERKKILKMASEQAETIKEKAQEEGYGSGYNVGLEKGYIDGIKEAKEETKNSRENALDMIVQAKRMVDEYFQESRESIIKLSVNMAESIVNYTIDENSEGILSLIKPVIEEYNKKQKIIISCHRDRYDFLKKKIEELEEISPETKFFVFKDNNLDINDCILESEDQVIDLSIKNQLDSIISTIEHME